MTTTIIVISDTHCHSWDEVNEDIRKKVSEADIAVHCGDIVRQPVVDGFLKDAQKGYIVHGNSDPTELREALPYIEVFEVEGVKIGAIHPAWGGPEFPPEELFKDFDKVPDVILFGHTHVPMNRYIEKVLFVNPGQGYSSFMVDCTIAELRVRDGEVDSRIITIKKNTP